MIIPVVTLIALVAPAIGIDGDALADFEGPHIRPDLVYRAYELVSEDQRPVLTGEFSLEGTLCNLKFKPACGVPDA